MGTYGDILVERVARATLTNVDSLIDWLIDAPGLRPARDCRYGETSFYILYLLNFFVLAFIDLVRPHATL